ncbi:MAG: hypothetical protein JSW47_09605 [Phycisphaerales bacterium]|nr:MAG: hypothetical protein JSW47_09605 [Phycisphaerales bacterium]UCF14557.1 MAG: hypothetical protein JSW59_14175 [Phycisphaerales bacterium]
MTTTSRREKKSPQTSWQKHESITPKEMTQAFFQACADEDWDELVKFMPHSTISQKAKDLYGGLEIINIGEPFQSDDYHGLLVPSEIKRDGQLEITNLKFGALTVNGRHGRWYVVIMHTR